MARLTPNQVATESARGAIIAAERMRALVETLPGAPNQREQWAAIGRAAKDLEAYGCRVRRAADRA